MSRRVLTCVASGALVAGLMVGTAASPAAAGTTTMTSTGSFTVPTGVVSLLASAQGAGGGGGEVVVNKDGGAGGVGALVTSSLGVASVGSLNINIGSGGAPGGSGAAAGGSGGQATSISENGGSIVVTAGGGGGGASGNSTNANGGGNDGGDAGTANNGGGHDGSGNAGGGGGSKGNGGSAGGKGVTCGGCTEGKAGSASQGGDGAVGSSTSGQGGQGGQGFGGGGGGGLAPSPAGTTRPTKSNGGGGAGGSRADGAGVLQSNTTKAASGGGVSGKVAGPVSATAGSNGAVNLTWLNQASSVHVVPGTGQATVTWTQPAQESILGDVAYEVFVDGVASGKTDNTGSVITGLQNGKTYKFTVVARAQTSGSPKFQTRTDSAPVNIGPATTPGAPSTPLITSWGSTGDNGWANLKWSTPSNNGGAKIIDYHVEYAAANNPGLWFAVPGCGATSALTCKSTGLVDDVPYIFKVRAVNAIGSGDFSGVSARVTPVQKPPAPKSQSPAKSCVKAPSRMKLRNRTYRVMAANCKTNAGQPVRVKVSGKSKVRGKRTYKLFKVKSGKYKGSTSIKVYSTKVNLKLTWSASSKARSVYSPNGPSYKAYSKSKSYKVR